MLVRGKPSPPLSVPRALGYWSAALFVSLAGVWFVWLVGLPTGEKAYRIPLRDGTLLVFALIVVVLAVFSMQTEVGVFLRRGDVQLVTWAELAVVIAGALLPLIAAGLYATTVMGAYREDPVRPRTVFWAGIVMAGLASIYSLLAEVIRNEVRRLVQTPASEEAGTDE